MPMIEQSNAVAACEPIVPVDELVCAFTGVSEFESWLPLKFRLQNPGL